MVLRLTTAQLGKYAKDKPVIGIRSDFGNAGDTSYGRVNAMIEESCVAVAKDLF